MSGNSGRRSYLQHCSSAAKTGVSDIQGSGHGSQHLWMIKQTLQRNLNGKPPMPAEKHTLYECLRCSGLQFKHFYDMQPNIFRAMELAGVPEGCSSCTSNPQ